MEASLLQSDDRVPDMETPVPSSRRHGPKQIHITVHTYAGQLIFLITYMCILVLALGGQPRFCVGDYSNL